MRRKHKYRNDMEKPFNFCREAAKGCHVCLMAPNRTSEFLIGLEKFFADEYDSDVEIPSVALDPDTNTLTLTNTNDYALSATLSVKDIQCLGKDGKELEVGQTVSKDGVQSTCTTFILKVPAYTFLHVCRLAVDLEKEKITDRDELLEFVMQKLDSDVQRCEGHARPDDFHPLHLTFPLQNANENKEDWYLCTQGVGGSFTHTFYGNYHAVDFRCDVGTPIVAGADGIVTDIRNNADDKSTGISASNLYAWNSIQIRVTEEVGFIKEEGEEEINADSAERRCSGGASTTTAAAAAAAQTGIAGLSISQEGTASASAAGSSSHKVGQAGPLYIEYVHVQENSFRVKVGDVVKRGQIICNSGESGFCPEPHLHFSAFRTSDSKAPTVGVKFIASEGNRNAFVPEAGKMYNARVGEMKT